MSQRKTPTLDDISVQLAVLEQMALEGLTQNDEKERLAFIAEHLLYARADLLEIVKNLTALCGFVFVAEDDGTAQLPPVVEVH
ncbi:hypothetical protein [Avibacterium avium]|uniref:hypothetical protein n=1 Tax=Avibacterium avium TaxID=751 RepID=UPI003BF7AECF